MPKVFVSPSTQGDNTGVGSYGTEKYRMQLVADFVCAGLSRNHIENRRDDPNGNFLKCVADSNAYKPDIHVAIHSNAGGGQGTEIWAYVAGAPGDKLAHFIYNYLAPLSPGVDRGVKYNSKYAEIGQTDATAIIIETGFHDYAPDANWIVNNPKQIAEAIVHGICDYFGMAYITDAPPPVPTPPVPVVDTEKELLKSKVAELQKQMDALNAKIAKVKQIVGTPDLLAQVKEVVYS